MRNNCDGGNHFLTTLLNCWSSSQPRKVNNNKNSHILIVVQFIDLRNTSNTCYLKLLCICRNIKNMISNSVLYIIKYKSVYSW